MPIDEDAIAFWSYTHDDDKHEAGAIRQLADRIREEYSLLTGEELNIFIDRDDISWGDEWKARIDNALVATTFFIPILTPRYFKQSETRRELFEFARQAQSLGVAELICPILYAPVPGLVEDSPDEAMALVARSQYEKWFDLRLCDDRSAQHRRAVNRLANRLAEVAAAVGSRQAVEETSQTEEDVRTGLGEALEMIRTLLPGWLEAVESDGVVREQFLATDSMLEERKRRLKSGPAGARYMVLRQQLIEYLPLVERRAELAEEILRKTVALSPLVTRVVRIVAAHPEDEPALKEIVETVQRAGAAYRKHDKPMEPVAAWARRHAHETRGMLTLARACDRHDASRQEVRVALRGWTSDVKMLSGLAEALLAAPTDSA